MKRDFFTVLRDKIRTSGIPATQLSREAGILQSSLSKFLSDKNKPNAQKTLSGENVAKLVSYFQGELVFSGDVDPKAGAQDVRLVNTAPPMLPEAPETKSRMPTPRPQAENYLAVPLVADFAAGPGHILTYRIKDWFVVSRNHMAARVRRNLIAVQIGRGSHNMEPTLRPGDIVLVDRDDQDVMETGRLFLAREPSERDGASVKRVSVSEMASGKDWRVTYYSDNPACPPGVYSLREDFDNDWGRVVIGRVVCVWADMMDR